MYIFMCLQEIYYRNMEINMKNYELLGVVDMNGMNRLRGQKIGGGKQKSSTHV